MLCNKCQKRPAIVFVQRMENGEMKNEGYCLSCARELGIKPLDDIMKQFGISGEDLEAMEDRFAGMMESGDMDPSEMMQNMMGMGAADGQDAGQDEEEESPDGDGSGEERFVPGGAGTFPLGIFASRKKEDGEKKDPRAKEKGKKRKFLDNYCENLTQKARDGRLDAIIGRYTAPSRYSRAARRTTPASSARRAWAKRPLPRALRCASPRARCPRA